METTLWFLVAILLPSCSLRKYPSRTDPKKDLQFLSFNCRFFCILMRFETESLYNTDGARTLDLSVLDYKDMKDSSPSKSPQSLYKVWQSGIRLGPFKSQLGTPRAGSRFRDLLAGKASAAVTSKLLSPRCPALRVGCFLELQGLGVGKMSRIYHDSALRNKAVQSARLPGTWDPITHQG